MIISPRLHFQGDEKSTLVQHTVSAKNALQLSAILVIMLLYPNNQDGRVTKAQVLASLLHLHASNPNPDYPKT